MKFIIHRSHDLKNHEYGHVFYGNYLERTASTCEFSTIMECYCIIIPWMHNNFGNYDEKRWVVHINTMGNYTDSMRIYLRDEEDAIAVKLRWL